MNKEAATVAAASDLPSAASRRAHRRRTGSLSRRMIGVAAFWIAALLLIGGFALDRVLSRSFVDSFDNQLVYMLNSMVDAAEIGPLGEVRFSRAPADQRFIQPYSGLYYQVTDLPADSCRLKVESPLCDPSRSLWDRRLRVSNGHFDVKPHLYDSDEFSSAGHKETLRVAERDIILPGSKVRWRFQVAEARELARSTDSSGPADSVLELHGAWRRPSYTGSAADLLWAVATSAGSARGGGDPFWRQEADQPQFPG